MSTLCVWHNIFMVWWGKRNLKPLTHNLNSLALVDSTNKQIRFNGFKEMSPLARITITKAIHKVSCKVLRRRGIHYLYKKNNNYPMFCKFSAIASFTANSHIFCCSKGISHKRIWVNSHNTANSYKV